MLTFSLVALLLAAVYVAGQEPDWGFQSYLDENYTLYCNHSELVVAEYNAVRWELPSGQRLTGNTEKFTLESVNKVEHGQLFIKRVEEADSGIYVCHVYSDISMSIYRGQILRGLNIGGHMYRELFDKYRDNLMIGGLAALIFLVPLITGCLVYRFRYQSLEQRQQKHQIRLEANRRHQQFEANGKGTELQIVSDGEINAGYDNLTEDSGTRM